MRLSKIATLTSLLAALGLGLGTLAFAQGAKNAKKADSGDDGEGKKPEKKDKSEKKKQKGEAVKYDLEVTAVLGAPAKSGGDFYEVSYVETGKKAAKKKAWLKIDSSTVILRDRAADLKVFKEGDNVMVLGKPYEPNSQGGLTAPGGQPDRRINAARIVMGGKSVRVNEGYSDPKDKKIGWCEAQIEKIAPALSVTFESLSYKVMLDKGATILIREEGDLKQAKKGTRLVVEANAVSEKPSDETGDTPAFKAERVVFLEPRATRSYDAILP